MGEALIKTHKNWYKGSYLFLLKEFKLAKNNYTSIKELLDTLNLYTTSLNPNVYENILNHIDFFTNKSYQEKLHKLINLHKDYESLISVILNNLSFVIKHFETINKWLSSSDFKIRYKDENHPYPSLLDPNKLKDTNGELNYHTIDTNLAWELNLPLPDNYEFVWLQKDSCASIATLTFFNILVKKFDNLVWLDQKSHYNSLMNFKTASIHQRHYRLLYLLPCNINLIYIARDPISIIKHALNHIGYDPSRIYYGMKEINLSTHINSSLFHKPYYIYAKDPYKIEVSDVDKIILNYGDGYFNTRKRLKILKNKIKSIECLEFSEFNTKNAFNTFTRLAHKYNFTPPKDPLVFEGRANRNQGDLLVLPVNLHINKNCKIIITTNQLHHNKQGFININKDIFENRVLMFDNLILLIKEQEYVILKNDQALFQKCKDYINNYIDALEQHEIDIKNNLINEEQILEYLREQKDLRNRLKNLIDDDLTYVRENHPEYIEKWKYYKEFEKICEELDNKA